VFGTKSVAQKFGQNGKRETGNAKMTWIACNDRNDRNGCPNAHDDRWQGPTTIWPAPCDDQAPVMTGRASDVPRRLRATAAGKGGPRGVSTTI
jgi:hypothetical protein